MNDLSDKVLFDLLKENNEKAFRELYDRYWRKLYAAALNKLASADDAADMVQNIFVNIWQNRHNINIRTSIASYFFSILRYELYDFYQKKGKTIQTSALDPNDEELHQQVMLLSQIEEKELKLIIDREIEQMPEKMRQVYLLSKEEELSAIEIASLLSISVQTVRNQLHSAVKRLREQLSLKYPLN